MQTAMAEQDIPDNLPKYNYKIDIAEAFKLRFKHHLSFGDIALRLGCSRQAVQERLETFTTLINNSNDSKVYDENRANILTAVEFDLVKDLLDKGKRQKATLGNVAYAISQINNMIRLEKGQPTAITEHLDADLGGLIDQLCGLKSAGSGSTVDVRGNSDTPAAASLPSSPDDDILSSLLPAVPDDPGTFTPDQSTAPAADRSIQAKLEGTNSPVNLTKSGNARKPHTAKPSKSATNSRKQNLCNITSALDSKIDTVKQGSNPIQPAEATSAAGKEWYE